MVVYEFWTVCYSFLVTLYIKNLSALKCVSSSTVLSTQLLCKYVMSMKMSFSKKDSYSKAVAELQGCCPNHLACFVATGNFLNFFLVTCSGRVFYAKFNSLSAGRITELPNSLWSSIQTRQVKLGNFNGSTMFSHFGNVSIMLYKYICLTSIDTNLTNSFVTIHGVKQCSSIQSISRKAATLASTTPISNSRVQTWLEVQSGKTVVPWDPMAIFEEQNDFIQVLYLPVAVKMTRKM